MRKRETITLKELATRLGLSPSTVSRVLNDPAGAESRWASSETNQKIFDLAKELGYAKNPYAASLRTARSKLIGVVVPRLQDYVLATIYEGIDEAATEHGYVAVVANSLDRRELHDRRVQKLLDRRVDGLIFGDTPFDGSTLESMRGHDVPLVLVNRRSPGSPSVTCDDYRGGWLAGQQLVEQGARKIFLVSGKSQMSTSIDRTAGFTDALAEHGIELPQQYVATGGFDVEAGEKAAIQLLAEHGVPDAFFAVNDFAAIGVLGVLNERGLTSPDDVLIIGYNDTPLASGIALTSVRSPMHEMGKLGFQMLQELMDGKEVESTQIEPELIIRKTA